MLHKKKEKESEQDMDVELLKQDDKIQGKITMALNKIGKKNCIYYTDFRY